MSKAKPFLIEAVVDSVESALAAQHAGADRLELCSGLETGGLTPGRGLLEMVCSEVSVPVFVLRTRGGDFHYTDAEFDNGE
ncbi:MAG: copper homeostasis protein CutC [Bacteroidia bacterium]